MMTKLPAKQNVKIPLVLASGEPTWREEWQEEKEWDYGENHSQCQRR
jgi:hypothetical protein